jgi:hypothetical protein
VVPPVFKTGERCAAALAGSIPVRLRHLRKGPAAAYLAAWPFGSPVRRGTTPGAPTPQPDTSQGDLDDRPRFRARDDAHRTLPGVFAQLAADGKFTVPIARTFPLDEWRTALDTSLGGNARGKLLPGTPASDA